MIHKILPLITLGLGIAIGLLLPSPANPSVSQEIRKSNNYQFINPLLECDNSIFPSQDGSLGHLKDNLIKLIENLQHQNKLSFASVYYRDLNNGPWFGINEKEDFSPASLIKIHMMIAYLKQAETNPTILDQQLTNNQYTADDNQNIPPTQPLTPNQNYTISQLIDRMIIDSDNAAHELLFDYIDGPTLNQVYRDLNINIDKAISDPAGNIVSVKDYASAFRILYNASYLNHDMSEKALKLLSQTKYRQALVAGIPQNITVAHKFGERGFPNGDKQLHDCGIVYLPQKPYLLCVMTRGQNFDQLAQSIKTVSQTVFDHFNQSR